MEDDDKFKPEGKLSLKIEKFSGFAREQPYTSRNSASVYIQGIEWYISANKLGSDPEYMGVYLKCRPEIVANSFWSCETSYSFTILARIEEEQHDPNPKFSGGGEKGAGVATKQRKRPRNSKFSYKIVRERETRHVFGAKSPSWGISYLIKFEELLHPENGAYDIETDAIIIEAVVNARVPCGVKLNWHKQTQIFEKGRSFELYDSGDFCDCVIKFVDTVDAGNNKEFNVHKYVLAMHSDVFRAMFTNKDTAEYKESRVEIEDGSATAIQQMILYMYTGKVQSEFKQYEADDLLAIADKYQIEHLAVAVEQRLIESLTVENVCRFLMLADLHNAHSLREACGKIIRKNLKAVKRKDRWYFMKKYYPELLFDVLEESSDSEQD